MTEAANFYLKQIADNTTQGQRAARGHPRGSYRARLQTRRRSAAAARSWQGDTAQLTCLHRQQQGGGVGTRKNPVHKPNGDSVGQAILEFVYSQIALNNADTSHYWGMTHWTKDNMRADLRTESPYYPDFNAGPYVTWDYQGIDPEFSTVERR